jgi:hypothetical protein
MIRVASLLFVCLLAACRGSGVPVAPTPSPYFEAVSSRLELGGEVFAYADIDGDAEQASEFLLGLLRDAPELRGIGDVSRLHGASLARVLGLDRTRAIGLSSVVDGTRYRNRGFVYAAERTGLLQVWGDAPRELGTLAMAPFESDLVFEQQLDADELVALIRGLGELGIGMPPEALDAWLDAQRLDLTMRDVLEGLKTTVGVILSVDEGRNVWLPGQTFTFPHTSFIVAVDGVSELADSVARYAASEPFLHTRESNGWTIVSPAIRLPAPWNAYEPALMKHAESGRTYFVSSPAFLKECLASGGALATNASFQVASAGLPDTGNSFLYLSPRMTRVMHAALDKVIAAQGPAIQTQVARALLPDAGEPYAWILRNEPEGVLVRSNGASSHKSTLLTFGFAALLPAAILLTPPAPDPTENPL